MEEDSDEEDDSNEEDDSDESIDGNTGERTLYWHRIGPCYTCKHFNSLPKYLLCWLQILTLGNKSGHLASKFTRRNGSCFRCKAQYYIYSIWRLANTPWTRRWNLGSLREYMLEVSGKPSCLRFVLKHYISVLGRRHQQRLHYYDAATNSKVYKIPLNPKKRRVKWTQRRLEHCPRWGVVAVCGSTSMVPSLTGEQGQSKLIIRRSQKGSAAGKTLLTVQSSYSILFNKPRTAGTHIRSRRNPGFSYCHNVSILSYFLQSTDSLKSMALITTV